MHTQTYLCAISINRRHLTQTQRTAGRRNAIRWCPEVPAPHACPAVARLRGVVLDTAKHKCVERGAHLAGLVFARALGIAGRVRAQHQLRQPKYNSSWVP
jgi:hypothetical protein